MTARRLATGLLGLALLSSVVARPAAAVVSRVTVETRHDLLGGRPFGTAGGYEKLAGVVEFALDTANAANAAIVDLARAPKDASGRVTASANFMVLRPKTIRREQAVALLERSEEHTSELQSQSNLVCRLLLEKKKKIHHIALAPRQA